MTLSIVVVSTIVFLMIVVYVYLVHYVAVQAKQRGYTYWQWLVLGLLGNSIIFAVLLALLPDRSLEARRQVKRDLLAEKLRARKCPFPTMTTAGGIVQTSVGDMATIDPEKLGVSMGDQPTSLGNMDRSLGDQATHAPDNDL